MEEHQWNRDEVGEKPFDGAREYRGELIRKWTACVSSRTNQEVGTKYNAPLLSSEQSCQLMADNITTTIFSDEEEEEEEEVGWCPILLSLR